jgi:hypothetical protein
MRLLNIPCASFIMSECCYFVFPLSCLETVISGEAEISALQFLSPCKFAFLVNGPKTRTWSSGIFSGCLEQ